MRTEQEVPSQGRANLAMAALFVGMFVLGSAELLVVGVLNLIAADLEVSVPAAGTLVTAYALGLAIGGPILTALTITLNKRTVLIGTLILFTLGNLVAVLTADYGLFLVARVVTGALQGLFIAAAFAAGMSVVPPERRGRAISVVISGVTVSAALGLPVGTLVGQALGWRGSFVAVVVLAVIALVATLGLVPSVPSTGGGAAGQARYAFAPRVLAVLVLGSLVFAAVYSALTYIVPYLESATGISGALISVFLLAYGVATAVGSFGGGRFADADAARPSASRAPCSRCTSPARSRSSWRWRCWPWGCSRWAWPPRCSIAWSSWPARAARWRSRCPPPRPTWASRSARSPVAWRSAASPRPPR
jgi:DHA1 family inner membrane transport protein